MAVLQPHYVWTRDVRVLVRLVRIVSSDASFGSEGKLGHDVANLLLNFRLFFRRCDWVFLLLQLLLRGVRLNTLVSLA